MATATIRNAEPSDYDRISPLVDDWWDGRPMRALLPRLFFEHFRETSFVAEEDGAAALHLAREAHRLRHDAESWRVLALAHLLCRNFPEAWRCALAARVALLSEPEA